MENMNVSKIWSAMMMIIMVTSNNDYGYSNNDNDRSSRTGDKSNDGYKYKKVKRIKY